MFVTQLMYEALIQKPSESNRKCIFTQSVNEIENYADYKPDRCLEFCEKNEHVNVTPCMYVMYKK